MFGALRDIVPRMLYTRHMEKPDDLLKFYDDEISEQFKQVINERLLRQVGIEVKLKECSSYASV